MNRSFWSSYQAGQAASVLPAGYMQAATEPGRAIGDALGNVGRSLAEGFEQMKANEERRAKEAKDDALKARDKRKDMDRLIKFNDDGAEGTRDKLALLSHGELQGLADQKKFALQEGMSRIAEQRAEQERAEFMTQQAQRQDQINGLQVAMEAMDAGFGATTAIGEGVRRHPQANADLLKQAISAMRDRPPVEAFPVEGTNYSAVGNGDKIFTVVPNASAGKEATGRISKELADGTRVSYAAPMDEVNRTMQAGDAQPGPDEVRADELLAQIKELEDDLKVGGEYTGFDFARGLGVQTKRSDQIKALRKELEGLGNKIEQRELRRQGGSAGRFTIEEIK